MSEKRVYQRYTINDEEKKNMATEIRIDGIVVQLVNFSLGGLCVLTQRKYAVGDIVTIAVTMEKSGKIDLTGKVVRVASADNLLSVAIDLSHHNQLKSLRKA